MHCIAGWNKQTSALTKRNVSSRRASHFCLMSITFPDKIGKVWLLFLLRNILFVCLSDAWMSPEHKLSLEDCRSWSRELQRGCAQIVTIEGVQSLVLEHEWSKFDCNKRLVNIRLSVSIRWHCACFTQFSQVLPALGDFRRAVNGLYVTVEHWLYTCPCPQP